MVSVIVPAYNAERHITRCLESILCQTHQDIEVIVVNDGSTDRTDEICRQKLLVDSRIIYFAQSNQGPSSARNLGLEKALGEFILFADADDTFEKNAIEKLLEGMSDECQLILFGYNEKNEKGDTLKGRIHLPPKSGIVTLCGLSQHLYDYMRSQVINSLCNKLYRKSIIDRYGLTLDEDIKYGEDFVFNMNYLSCISRVNSMRLPLYNYCVSDSQSLTKRRYKEGLFWSQCRMFDSVMGFLKTYDAMNAGNRQFFSMYFLKGGIQASLENLFYSVEKKVASQMESIREIVRSSMFIWIKKNIVWSSLSFLDKLTIYLSDKEFSLLLLSLYKMKSVVRYRLLPHNHRASRLFNE